MINMTTMTGMAGFGIIIGFWNNIKLWFSKIVSLFIVSINVDGYSLNKGLSMFLIKNFKPSPLGSRDFTGVTEFVQPLKRNQIVVFEKIPHEKTLWVSKKEKFKWIWVTNHGSAKTISFLRCFYKKHDFLIECTDEYNHQLMNDDEDWRQYNRFFVQKMTGTIGENKKSYNRGRDGMEDESPSSGKSLAAPVSEEAVDKHVSFPLKWQKEELGIAKRDSAINDLSLKKDHVEFVKDAILWRNSEKWFKERLIPWKRGVLLWGKPGTGKTAFVRSLGQELNMPIISFDLATMSNQDFNRIWKDTIGTYAPCICLFEDIDGVFDGRENIATRGKMDQGLSFDCFLNSLDGVENTDGLFIVVSTNNIEKLDNAIGIPNNGDGMSTRPGRIDRTLFFDSLDKDGREKMANRILGDFEREKWEHIMGFEKDTGAQFQERCCRLALSLFWENKS